MKKIKYFSILMATIFITQFSASAQDRMKLRLNYGVTQPLGSLNSYIDKTSINGWGAALDYTVNENWHAGLQVGFADFYKKVPRQVYTSGTQHISAVKTESLQITPVLLEGAYYFGDDPEKIRPYARLGLGGAFIRNDTYWGQFNTRDKGFSFAASPGAGISLPLGRYKTSAFQLGIQYNYVPYSSENVENLNSVQANIGFAFPLR